MQKLTIPITTTSDQQKILQITSKTALLKKRLVKTWTIQEDQKLVTLYDQYPKKWNIISQQMKNRNQNQCLHRFRRICRLGQNKKIWSHQEDQTVLQMINQVGHNWRAIAQKLGTKSGKQIRERFINKLDPNICRQEWTEAEDMKIIELFTKMGSKWCEISKALPGRPQNRIKNRFYSYIQKNYEFKIKESLQPVVKLQVIQNKENSSPSPRTAGIKFIQQKTPSSLQKRQSNISNFTKMFVERQQNVQQTDQQGQLQQQVKQEPRSNQQPTKHQKMDQEKENNYNSMKEINDECYFKYQPGQNNNDLLYFQDN